MQHYPAVSIILPTYNRSQFLPRAIQSVLDQTFADLELIIVNDASTDDTVQTVAQFNDERIRFLSHPKNMGGSAARNTGLRQARGANVGFLDDDDMWHPLKLEKQLCHFNSLGPKIGIVYSAFNMAVDRSGGSVSHIAPYAKGNLYPEIMRRNFFSTATTLVKKCCFDRVGWFDEDLPSCQDWDMWIRIAKYYEIDFVMEPLATIFIHGSQISNNLEAKIIGREILMEKNRQDLVGQPEILAYLLKRLGILSALADRRLSAVRYFMSSLNVLPKQKGCYAYIAMTLLVPTWHKNYLMKKYITIAEGIPLFY